jgi:hypothetical protein
VLALRAGVIEIHAAEIGFQRHHPAGLGPLPVGLNHRVG